MGSRQYQAMRHDGQTGKATSVSRFTTAENADRIRREERQQVPDGSSDWFTVDRTRRKGRGR